MPASIYIIQSDFIMVSFLLLNKICHVIPQFKIIENIFRIFVERENIQKYLRIEYLSLPYHLVAVQLYRRIKIINSINY